MRWQLSTPVALIIFNRPNKTLRVFLEIAKAKPSVLLIVGDGPRINNINDEELVEQARKIVNLVDWPCKLLINFSKENMGCRLRVSSGIDWIFSQVEEAIILEDDCLPDPTFFLFCEEMLGLYRYDEKIGMIAGTNFHIRSDPNLDSYFFSRYSYIWGWATWRSRWEAYDVNMKKWNLYAGNDRLETLFGSKERAAYWRPIFESAAHGNLDTWDYQWLFANLVSGRLNIVPENNLITNIGFDESATHTTGKSEIANLPTTPLQFPLKHPHTIQRDIDLDKLQDKKFYKKSMKSKLIDFIRVN